MCQHRISTWAFVLSPSPVHIRCSGCGMVLRVRMRGLIAYLALATLVLGTLAGYAVWHFVKHANYVSYVWTLLTLLLLCALEFGTPRLYARHASLKARQPSQPTTDHE